MGEFTTRVRFSQEIDENGLSFGRINDFRKAEYIYSWRSRRTKYDLEDVKTGNTVGIRTPRTTGNLLERLADRKRYTEDVGRALSNTRSDTDFAKIKVCLAEDLGHPFTSVKWESLQEGRVLVRNPAGTVITTGPVLATKNAYSIPEVGSTPGFVTSVLPTGLSAPSVLERNARLNPVFQSMSPTESVAQIGETIVSLLRGDIPHILSRIENLARQFNWQKATKVAGGEYLNTVFGWTPLIRDFENAIKVLTTVDHLLYGTAYRRHRSIQWPGKWVVTPVTTLPVTSGYSTSPTRTTNATTGKGESQAFMSYDIRLSARLTPIARPGLGANSFIDQAEDKLQQLGLWYPTLGWDLLPYSWLIDWATSLGSSLNNALVFGREPGMVKIDYAWATSCLRVLTHVNFKEEGWVFSSGNYQRYAGHPKTLSSVKTRYPASPFGFGLDLSALTGGQVAILVALGLAKRP